MFTDCSLVSGGRITRAQAGGSAGAITLGTPRRLRIRGKFCVVDDLRCTHVVDEQSYRLSNTASRLVHHAALCVTATQFAHGSDPPSRGVSLICDVICLHDFFNHPFPGQGSTSRSMRRSSPARCPHRREPERWSRSRRIRRGEVRRAAWFRRSHETPQVLGCQPCSVWRQVTLCA